MTHEELLAKIDWAGSNTDGNDTYSALSLAITNSMNALRAVVELHKPTERTPGYSYGPYCTHEMGWEWPCPTIQAIEKELQ